ncbi:hypothetical protein BU14_0746s0003 [Porphyra umbilicalis]|uniref:Uncharacterized protein n=1 Tax=Porphyra umbilicalis TaxID=2786 RepID=A0A1X6NQ24_PORUM|nr:hypothetical protein BU14_0746s0003 [Porphyra umbilicalis]|eukprot:OSX70463.1 hypothetical protein BU14_0746s0003 [Porphyra umbilicalis]
MHPVSRPPPDVRLGALAPPFVAGRRGAAPAGPSPLLGAGRPPPTLTPLVPFYTAPAPPPFDTSFGLIATHFAAADASRAAAAARRDAIAATAREAAADLRAVDEQLAALRSRRSALRADGRRVDGAVAGVGAKLAAVEARVRRIAAESRRFEELVAREEAAEALGGGGDGGVDGPAETEGAASVRGGGGDVWSGGQAVGEEEWGEGDDVPGGLFPQA